MIPENFIEELKYLSDIEKTISSYVDLKRLGGGYTGLCPFHSEKTPSFKVYPDTQSYYCFGCGKGGDVITFIREIEHIDYIEAIKFLANKSGLAMPELADDGAGRIKARLFEINRESAIFFHNILSTDDGEKARSYLIARGLTHKIIKRFGIGYAPDSWNSLRDHLYSKGFSKDEVLSAAVVVKGRADSVYDMFRDRIMFPIIDLRGGVIGFGGRNLGEKGPKYLNSPDTLVFKKSRNLYALGFAKTAGSDTMILGEGYMDVVAMNMAGFTNSVATLGTSLTKEQTRLISQYAKKVVIAYDSDDAGRTAAKRAINLFSNANLFVTVLELDGAKDPDEYIKKFGAHRFQKLIEGGKSAIEFEIDRIKSAYDLNISDEKVNFLSDFCSLISGIDSPLQRDVYIGKTAQELGVSAQTIISSVDMLRTKQIKAKNRADSKKLVGSIADKIGTENQPSAKNISSLTAQELLLTMLLAHPDALTLIEGMIDVNDFTDNGYREIFRVLSSRIKENQSIELIYMSAMLENNLMAKLSELSLRSTQIIFYKEQATEYAKAIKKVAEVGRQEITDMSNEEYKDYLELLKVDKR